ncbi:hypothetical protein ID47_05175 [Candidatus Paracaedibacter acanthamoebae]|uniref:Transposase DDE domain-containing protein n=1 Tax=Candidatus Odyssella acanthamoebae TaxID=91604 RepID=A0A077ASS9_9PROT|nr:hypothetical protein ID47_05175 [Candidatus Paracaedibacter acanthamoebae]
MPADISDRKGAFYLLEGKRSFLPCLSHMYGDGGYEGHNFIETLKQRTGWTLTIVKRSNKHGFNLLPKRWIVERTFAWLNKNRRLSKDYELHTQTAEGFIYLAMIRLMLRRKSLLS